MCGRLRPLEQRVLRPIPPSLEGGCLTCDVCGAEAPLVGGLCELCRLILNLTDRQVQAICDHIDCERLEEDPHGIP